MTIHQFMLIVDGPDLQEEPHVQALFETGCDDAAVGRMGTLQYLDFDREAEAFAEAVLSAMTAIEEAEAVSFISSPDDLVTLAEIAERTGGTRESIRLLTTGERGPGKVPRSGDAFQEAVPTGAFRAVADGGLPSCTLLRQDEIMPRDCAIDDGRRSIEVLLPLQLVNAVDRLSPRRSRSI